jgi:hypothetical protein
MKKEKPLVDREFRLEKYPGKGGWTYAAISEIPPDKKAPFGWVKVNGRIDTFELSGYKLMPMSSGKLFLPVRAEIRKQIKKKAGDTVHIVLYHDQSHYIIPEEIIACFELEPDKIFKNFLLFTEGQQKAYVDWINKAKTPETKAKRIATMMELVAVKKKLHDVKPES